MSDIFVSIKQISLMINILQKKKKKKKKRKNRALTTDIHKYLCIDHTKIVFDRENASESSTRSNHTHRFEYLFIAWVE